MRRQTRAVVELLRRSQGLAGHFLFMEDDFVLCPHALRALAYVTSKAHAYFPGSDRPGGCVCMKAGGGVGPRCV